jgi:poly(A) polymerase
MRKQPSTHDAALAVVRRLREHGHNALWAGGCVRDMLLGHEPSDIDVATDAPPDRIAGLFRNSRQVGAKFGVVMVRQGPHWIETATFRSDIDYRDGRHPEQIVFTTAQEDAQRRDFTINGLFYDPINEQVIDYVDGRRDLEAGLVRAVGDPGRRFAEDHLRLLRAVRFSARFGFPIEPATAAAIREQAASITRISPERIREELEKMFQDRSRAEAVRQLADLGLLPHLWPQSHWPPERISSAVAVLSRLPTEADFAFCTAALLHQCSPGEARRITRELRCSNYQIARATWMIEHVDEIHHGQALCLPALKKLIAHRGFDDLIDLHRAICLARELPLDDNEAVRRRRDALSPDEITPPPLVTGQDLLDLGLVPGPRFKQILERLYDEQLDNRLNTRDQALDRMRALSSGEWTHEH